MNADVVVIGAGIAGTSIAHALTVEHGLDVVIVDPRPPLTLTSDKSTECYRNWWPSAPMVGLMNHSIDRLESHADQTDNLFGLSRRGYLFVTSRPETLAAWEAQSGAISGYGGGEVRKHADPAEYTPASPRGYHGQPDGIDILYGPEVIGSSFPYITTDAVAALHVRRAGWFSAQQLGSWMLDEAKGHGLEHLVDRAVSIDVSAGEVSGVAMESGSRIDTRWVVNAAGPLSPGVGEMVDLDLPLGSEVHLKATFRDHLEVVPRDAPMLIWSDPQRIAWDPEEVEGLAAVGRDDLLGEMPVFCHGRPEGGADSPYFLALWEYHQDVREPIWPVPDDDMYPEVLARGLTTMIPGFGRYLSGLPHTTVDGGYYTKTPENRPLIGPAGPAGFVLACGYSGFGVMVAAGAADLVARHITAKPLPPYPGAFLLSRYENREYAQAIAGKVDSGQL